MPRLPPLIALPYPQTPRRSPVHCRCRKGLFDLSVISSRAAWVNNTYITDDTDALAAYFGTIGTEKGVRYAKQAATISTGSGPRLRTPRASSTSCAARSSSRRRQTPGAAAELNDIATRLQSDLWQGPRDA